MFIFLFRKLGAINENSVDNTKYKNPESVPEIPTAQVHRTLPHESSFLLKTIKTLTLNREVAIKLLVRPSVQRCQLEYNPPKSKIRNAIMLLFFFNSQLSPPPPPVGTRERIKEHGEQRVVFLSISSYQPRALLFKLGRVSVY